MYLPTYWKFKLRNAKLKQCYPQKTQETLIHKTYAVFYTESEETCSLILIKNFSNILVSLTNRFGVYSGKTTS